MDPHRVLVAHEDPLARRYLIGLLDYPPEHGECLEAADRDALVEQLRGDADILFAIIDLSLPGLWSDASFRSLCAQLPALRLVFLFSSLSPEDAERLKDLRIASLLAKSTPEDMLAKTLRQISALAAADSKGTRSIEEGPLTALIEPVKLTARQADVMRLLSEGHSNREIARRLQLAEGTVKCHVNAGFRILGVHNRVSAARAFRENYSLPAPEIERAPLIG